MSSDSSAKTIVQYYCSISGMNEKNPLYLYISPKTVLGADDKLDEVFKLSKIKTRGGLPKVSLCGGILHSSKVLDIIKGGVDHFYFIFYFYFFILYEHPSTDSVSILKTF